jgi:glutathione S-transferase
MLQVYLDPCTVNSRKVLAGLDLVGIPFAVKHIDYFSGEHKKPEFLAINPNGAVPAAVDGDLALSESNAILQYAADLSGSEKYYPRDLKRRADINRWLLWEASTWFPSCYIYLVEYVVKPLLKTEPDEKIIAKEAPNWNRLAAVLDARLAKSKWLAGDTVTIADIAVAAPMHLRKWQRLPLDDHPNLKRWMAEIERLPCWQKTQGAVERALRLD